MAGKPMAWVVFAAVITVMLALDLGVFHRKAHVIGAREAAVWSVVWISVALLFNLGIYVHSGSDRALEFFQAWLIEKALSVDNLFVFLVAFSYFGVPAHLQHRVLFWGIIGALITRGAFIAVGAALLASFHFVMYIFGAFLIFTAARLLKGGDEEPHPEKNPVLRVFRRFVRLTKEYVGTSFFVRQDGRLYATPLLMVLVVIEATDVVFAVDSIPAVFGVTSDVFIVYTSNIFAVMGLRSLYFLLAAVVDRFHLLKYGLALILTFVGFKMLTERWIDIDIALSLAIIISVLAISIIASLVWTKDHPQQPPAPPSPTP